MEAEPGEAPAPACFRWCSQSPPAVPPADSLSGREAHVALSAAYHALSHSLLPAMPLSHSLGYHAPVALSAACHAMSHSLLEATICLLVVV